MRYEVRPLINWDGPKTRERAPARRFSAPWQSTLDLLDRETGMLGARLVVIQIDVTEADIRRDGMIRANAKAGFPGVKVSFESKYGPLTYATDSYSGWQANCRAIALGLEALRAVDRYGITKTGEQYRGFRAIEGAPSETMSADDAARFLGREAGVEASVLLNDRTAVGRAFKAAARKHHPDSGGDPALFRKVAAARDLLERNT